MKLWNTDQDNNYLSISNARQWEEGIIQISFCWVLRGGEGGGGVGGKGGGRGRGEKWTKPCMHIWIIKEKWKKNWSKVNKQVGITELQGE
jgi:hypothetical protein